MASFDSSFIDHELFKEGPVVIFVWKNEAGWPVETVTHNLTALYFYDPILYTSGKLKYSDQIHPEDLERVGGEVRDASECLDCSSFDHKPYRYLDGQGKYHWVKDSTRIIRNEEGNITHYIGYLVDITNEVALKEETVLLKERLDLAWQATNDGLWDWIIDEDIVYYSDRWKELIGYKSDEFPNESKEFFEHIHPEDRERVKQALEHHFMDPEHHLFEIDLRIQCQDGSYKWIQSRGKTSLNSDGTPHRMVGAHTDISERKRIEETIKELNATLEKRVEDEVGKSRQKDILLIQQSRLASMGEMIHNIAHQWRQPLNSLAVILSNIKDDYLYNELTKERLDHAVSKSQIILNQMSRTIDDFRDFFRSDKEAKLFDIVDVINETLIIIDASLSNNEITLIKQYEKPLECYGYSNQFSQVILNLLTNAKDAIKNKHIEKGKITIKAYLQEDELIIEIIDNAGGIDDAIISKIFDPYFTTKESGSGIGLYMAQMIVQRNHNGIIEAINNDEGATLIIRIPKPNHTDKKE